MPPKKPRRRYPNIEPMGTGWRAELARRGASVPTIARLMGHDLSSDTITSLYVTLHDPELRAAMGLLWEGPKATSKKRRKGDG